MPTEANQLRLTALWLFPQEAPFQPITQKEEEVASQLSIRRSLEYRHSRGYVRHALAGLWDVCPLDIPLKALPGQPPMLEKGWGSVSFSHSRDALLVGWSPFRLGVDVENSDRSFSSKLIVNRYFCREEKRFFADFKEDELRAKALRYWVVKEASIKWQRGSLSDDLTNWCFDPDLSLSQNEVLGYKLRVYQITYHNWTMAVVSEDILNLPTPMLCLG